MKTRILLILLASVFVFGFTSANKTETESMSTPQLNLLKVSNISELETILSNDDVVNYQIPIVWVGDAVYGEPGYHQLRITVRTYYEDNFGKGPISMIVDDNREVWIFNGSETRNSVEAAMSKDDNVDVDDD